MTAAFHALEAFMQAQAIALWKLDDGAVKETAERVAERAEADFFNLFLSNQPIERIPHDLSHP